MPLAPVRAPSAPWRIVLAALCLSVTLGGVARAADPPARARQVLLDAGTANRVVPPAADPEAGLGLLQRLALLIERIFEDRADAPPLAYAPSERPATPQDPTEIIAYSGPLAAGTVVINLERLQVYRILGGGFAALYQERSEDAVLARVGMAR